ncbi:MAG: hypothetical protein V4440_08525, partial [Pseudomonadota bacterium]
MVHGHEFRYVSRDFPQTMSSLSQSTSNSEEQEQNRQTIATSDTTILEFLKRTNPGVSFDRWHRLTGAGASSKDRLVAYAKTRNIIEGLGLTD